MYIYTHTCKDSQLAAKRRAPVPVAVSISQTDARARESFHRAWGHLATLARTGPAKSSPQVP